MFCCGASALDRLLTVIILILLNACTVLVFCLWVKPKFLSDSAKRAEGPLAISLVALSALKIVFFCENSSIYSKLILGLFIKHLML